jgi:integrase
VQRGSIVKHRNSWTLLYYDTVYRDGKPKRVRVRKKLASISKEYPTKRSARALADDLLSPVNQFQLTPESSLRITDFIDKHYFPSVEHTLRPSTVLNYKVSIYRKHLKHKLGTVRLRDFRTVTGQRLMRDISGVEHNTMLKIKNFLSGVFRFAKQQGFIDEMNPMTDVSVPGKRKKFKGAAYTIETAEAMLEWIEQYAQLNEIPAEVMETTQDVLALLSFTGLRQSEARGLRWSDWNEKEQTLSVERGVWRTHVGPTKTVESEGVIPVLPLLQSLLERRKARTKHRSDDYIFAGTRRGAPLDLHNMENRIIRPALKNTAVKWTGFHGFRRGLSTNLFALGVNPKIIAAILRHAGMAMTLKHYTMIPDAEQRAALAKLEHKIQNRPTGIILNGVPT